MRIILIIICFIAINSAEASTHLIFGYGSLINSELREKSMNGNSFAIPARISPEFGYARVWNFKGPSYSALGLTKQIPGSLINGIVYPVDVDDMRIWDRFEKGYDRIEVPREMIEFVGWLEPKEEMKVWIYIPQAELQLPPDENSPLLQTYLDTVLLGCLEHSQEFAEEFLETTYGWPKWWLDDRVVARNSWITRREQKQIDQLLSQYPRDPERNRFTDRKNYVDYEEMLAQTRVRS